MNNELMKNLVTLSGVGHIILCLGSLLVPTALKWKENLKHLQPLLRQLFWTYAGYILMINLSFGVISLLGTDESLSHSFLARYLNAMISVYWLTRMCIQFFFFDKTYAPKGIIFTLGEIVLVLLFISFFIIHALAFLHTIS